MEFSRAEITSLMFKFSSISGLTRGVGFSSGWPDKEAQLIINSRLVKPGLGASGYTIVSE